MKTNQNDLPRNGKRNSESRSQFLKEQQGLINEIEDLYVYFGVDSENEDQERNQKMADLLGLADALGECNDKEELREERIFSEIQDRVNSLEDDLYDLLKMHKSLEKLDEKSSVKYEQMPEWLKIFANEVHNQTKQLEELERIEDEKMAALWDDEKGRIMEGKKDEYNNLAFGVYQSICNALDPYYCWDFGLSYIISPAALKGVSEWVNEPSSISPKRKKWWLQHFLELLCLMLDYSWLSFELAFDDYPEFDQTFYEATQMLNKVKCLKVEKYILTV